MSVVGQKVILDGPGWGEALRGSVRIIERDEFEIDGTVSARTDQGDLIWVWISAPTPPTGFTGTLVIGDREPVSQGGTVDEPPIGSVIVTAFPDMEGDVAERMSDGHWLIVGEENLWTWAEIVAATDAPISVLRHGYGEH